MIEPRELALGALLLVAGSAFAQEEHAAPEGGPHELALFIGHTHVSQGIGVSGDRQWLALPSWSIDYTYRINARWSFGVHTDLILETYRVKEHLHAGEQQILERSFPIAPALMFSYALDHNWSVLAGPGREFAPEGDLFLLRLGGEYAHSLGGKWELAGNLAYDLRVNAYDSWSLGLGLLRRL
jgi:hypothetical protein